MFDGRWFVRLEPLSNMFDAGIRATLAQWLVSTVWSVFDQTCFNRLATLFNISMFGNQIMLEGVWSPNISRLSRALEFGVILYAREVRCKQQKTTHARETFVCHLKCLWNEIFFVLMWKAFQNTEEWCFSFWNIFFRFRDIDIFLLCKLDQWWRHTVCN